MNTSKLLDLFATRRRFADETPEIDELQARAERALVDLIAKLGPIERRAIEQLHADE